MNEQRQELAALYALGLLPSAEAEQFRALLNGDAELEFETEAYETVVNELALSPLTAMPAPDVRERLLARIAATPQERSAQSQNREKEAPCFVTRFDEGEWLPLAPHVSCKILRRDAASKTVTSLIKLEPGGYLPRHRHLGLEQTLIVSGDCIVNGQTFYAGDFRLREMGTEDTEVTTEFGTTILMIAPEHFEILDAAWAH